MSNQFVKWEDFKKKDKIFRMLEVIGQKLVIVYQNGQAKNGLALAVNSFNRHNRLTIRINYTTAHICEIELIGLW